MSSSFSGRKAETLGAVFPTEKVPEDGDNYVRLQEDTLLEGPGLYKVNASFRGKRKFFAREVAPPLDPKFSDHVGIREDRSYMLHAGKLEVNIVIHKSDSEPVILPQGTILGIVGEEIVEAADYDLSGFLEPSSKKTKEEYIALLRGSTSGVTEESPSEILLRDRTVENRLKIVARKEDS